MGWLGLKKGVTFDKKHSYRDYGMWMAGRPQIQPPAAKTNAVNIIGADGILDLTESTTGEIKYGNRTLSMPFVAEVAIEDQHEFKSRLMNDLHGKKMKVVLDEDSAFYYYGRCSVAFQNETPRKIKVVVTVDADPYKYEIEQTEMTFPLSTFGEETASYDWCKVQTPMFVMFPVGSKQYGAGNFSAFSSISIQWDAKILISNMRVRVRDEQGNEYQNTVPTPGFRGRLTISIEHIQQAGVDVSNILYVQVGTVGGDCSLVGNVTRGAKVTIQNGRMTVVPTFSIPSGGMSFIVNGRTAWLAAGIQRDPDIFLKPGENDIVFIAGENQPENASISVYFRRGWL